MKFAGRNVVISPLDPVPPGLRVGPRAVVMTGAEAKAVDAGDVETIDRLQRAIDAHDRKQLAEALGKPR